MQTIFYANGQYLELAENQWIVVLKFFPVQNFLIYVFFLQFFLLEGLSPTTSVAFLDILQFCLLERFTRPIFKPDE